MSQEVEFKKIVGEGKALGYLEGKACFCAGPLPGETALVETSKSQSKFTEVSMLEVTKPSAHRSEAREEHYQLCSPWQGVDYAYQLQLKRDMLAEIFGRKELHLDAEDLVPSPEQFGYRNKLEFTFLAGADKSLQLAFHARGSQTEKVALPYGCVLGSAAMNAAAIKILERINQLNISGYVESLTVRESRSGGQILAVLGLHQRAKRDWNDLKFDEAAGVIVSRVRPGHTHETLWSTGSESLTEKVGGLDLSYAYDGFFQTNVPAFEQALELILAAVPAGSRVVDLYGGVGTIGLPVAKKARTVIGVEINVTQVEQAEANAARAGLANYSAMAVPAGLIPDKLLQAADVVIVDPPRAGLDRRVVHALLDSAPKRIVYLSCNPVTQARDIMLLQEKYRASAVTGFDFYPGTLHLESLVVLDLG